MPWQEVPYMLLVKKGGAEAHRVTNHFAVKRSAFHNCVKHLEIAFCVDPSSTLL